MNDSIQQRFLAAGGGIDGRHCLVHQIIKFQRFNQIGIPDQRAILNSQIGALCPNGAHILLPLGKA